MDLFPLARRVLLTAYADTHAAIDAINVVDLDHYLLKPWDPPEEKLYPVIDGAARGVAGRRRPRDPAHQGDRPPLEPAVVGGAPVPGPQPALLPGVHGRRAQGQAAARRRRPGRPAAARRRSPSRARRSSSPPTPSWPTMLGLSTDAVAADVRPRRHRRRARGPGRRGLRRLRGTARRCSSNAPRPAGRPGGARGSRTTSASRRRLGRRADHVGPQAGRAVRRRGDHHARGRRAARSAGRRAPIEFEDGSTSARGR